MSPSAPERLLVRTSDFDEAVAAMRATFGDVDLRRDEFGRTGLTLHAAMTHELSAARWNLTGVDGASIDQAEQDESMFLTGLLLEGSGRVWSRWNDIDTNRPFFYPDQVDSALHQPSVANLGVSRALVDARARALTGDDSFAVRFTGTAPVDPAYDTVWRDTVVWVARTLDALSDRPSTELAQTGLTEVVASLMLRAFPNTSQEAVFRGDVGSPRTAALRRAIRFIDDNIDLPITVVEIAGAARLSTRGVYAAFRRELEVTPMEYLRRARLAAAHDELLDGGPVEAAPSIAIRWGFPHFGRFEELYREAYGEAPVDTLLR